MSGERGNPGDEIDEALLYGEYDLDAGAEAFLRDNLQDHEGSGSLDFNLGLASEVAKMISQDLPIDEREMDLDDAKAFIQAQQSVSEPVVAKPPLSDNPAEVIAVTSSLRGMVHAYFASLRLQHFLNCKRVRWVLMDTNKDVIAVRGLKNSQLLADWDQRGLLLRNNDGRPSIPQCIIDGVAVGDDVAMSELEEDGDLDYIINRTRCPNCLEDRDPAASFCSTCGKDLGPLIPDDIWMSNQVHHTFANLTIMPQEPIPAPGTVIQYVPAFRLLEQLQPQDSSDA